MPDSALKGKKVAYVACSDLNRWCREFRHQIVLALEAKGVIVTDLQDPYDPVLQPQHLDQAVAQKPDLIALLATNARSVVPGLRRAQAAGIPMINLVGPTVPESEPYFKASIENNHRQLGEFAATNLVEGLKKENRTTANIFVVTGAQVQPEVAVRMDGFKSVLDKYPEYKVVDIQDGNCPDQGEILVDGTPVTLTNARQVQAAGIAVVEQELSRVPALTVLENILLGRVGANLRSRTDDRRQVQGLLTRLGLNDVRPDTMVEDLSMAERQPVEIARALRRNARILILDEPTATLGEREIERVFAGVRELANAGSSVIFVSHRLGEVLDLCSQVTVLRDGRMIASQPAAEMYRQSIVELMLGRSPRGVNSRGVTTKPARASSLSTNCPYQDMLRISDCARAAVKSSPSRAKWARAPARSCGRSLV